jgi:hypothetical protein
MMDVSNGFHVKLPPRNPNNYDKCVQSSFGKYSGTIRVFPPKTQLNVLMIVDHQDSNSRRKCHFLNLSRFISAVTFFQSTCKRRLHGWKFGKQHESIARSVYKRICHHISRVTALFPGHLCSWWARLEEERLANWPWLTTAWLTAEVNSFRYSEMEVLLRTQN